MQIDWHGPMNVQKHSLAVEKVLRKDRRRDILMNLGGLHDSKAAIICFDKKECRTT